MVLCAQDPKTGRAANQIDHDSPLGPVLKAVDPTTVLNGTASVEDYRIVLRPTCFTYLQSLTAAENLRKRDELPRGLTLEECLLVLNVNLAFFAALARTHDPLSPFSSRVGHKSCHNSRTTKALPLVIILHGTGRSSSPRVGRIALRSITTTCKQLQGRLQALVSQGQGMGHDRCATSDTSLGPSLTSCLLHCIICWSVRKGWMQPTPTSLVRLFQ